MDMTSIHMVEVDGIDMVEVDATIGCEGYGCGEGAPGEAAVEGGWYGYGEEYDDGGGCG
jgi:hypothetical protein